MEFLSVSIQNHIARIKFPKLSSAKKHCVSLIQPYPFMCERNIKFRKVMGIMSHFLLPSLKNPLINHCVFTIQIVENMTAKAFKLFDPKKYEKQC